MQSVTHTHTQTWHVQGTHTPTHKMQKHKHTLIIHSLVNCSLSFLGSPHGPVSGGHTHT